MIRLLRIVVATAALVLMSTAAGASALDDKIKLEITLDKLIRDGNVEEIRTMLDHGMDPNFDFPPESETLLYVAVLDRQMGVIQLLIERGANTEVANKTGDTPLVAAARIGYDDAVRYLHSKGASLNHQNRGGATAVTLLSGNSVRLGTLKLLLSLGADPNIQDHYGNTALHWAAQAANLDVLRVLLADRRIEPSKINKEGYTPLALAKERSRYFSKNAGDPQAAVSMLKAAGAHELASNPVRLANEARNKVLGAFVSH
jgi:ankyrin repeat protein